VYGIAGLKHLPQEVTMSKEVAAAFLRMLARNKQLREELAEVAGRHGFQFSPDDLTKLDLEGLGAEADDADDHLSDRGFGAIESPP
jgi:hypothetical protein